jgi:hypothetical protein
VCTAFESNFDEVYDPVVVCSTRPIYELSDGAAAAQVTPFVKYFLNQIAN